MSRAALPAGGAEHAVKKILSKWHASNSLFGRGQSPTGNAVHGVQRLQSVFSAMDNGGKGLLNERELRRALGQLGVSLTIAQASELFAAVTDMNGCGGVSYGEFASLCRVARKLQSGHDSVQSLGGRRRTKRGRMEPWRGTAALTELEIPRYSATEDRYCPLAQTSKFRRRLRVASPEEPGMPSLRLRSPQSDSPSPLNSKLTFQRAPSREGSEAELEILRLIIMRERLLDAIRARFSVEALRSGGAMTMAPVVALLGELRTATLDVVEAISAWRKLAGSALPFVFGSENYLSKILIDLDFLEQRRQQLPAHVHCLDAVASVLAGGDETQSSGADSFSFAHNPLLITSALDLSVVCYGGEQDLASVPQSLAPRPVSVPVPGSRADRYAATPARSEDKGQLLSLAQRVHAANELLVLEESLAAANSVDASLQPAETLRHFVSPIPRSRPRSRPATVDADSGTSFCGSSLIVTDWNSFSNESTMKGSTRSTLDFSTSMVQRRPHTSESGGGVVGRPKLRVTTPWDEIIPERRRERVRARTAERRRGFAASSLSPPQTTRHRLSRKAPSHGRERPRTVGDVGGEVRLGRKSNIVAEMRLSRLTRMDNDVRRSEEKLAAVREMLMERERRLKQTRASGGKLVDVISRKKRSNADEEVELPSSLSSRGPRDASQGLSPRSRRLVRRVLAKFSTTRSLFGHVQEREGQGRCTMTDPAAIFSSMDGSGNGMLDKNELVIALKRLGLGLTDAESDAVFATVDVDRSGGISLTEFMDIVGIASGEEHDLSSSPQEGHNSHRESKVMPRSLRPGSSPIVGNRNLRSRTSHNPFRVPIADRQSRNRGTRLSDPPRRRAGLWRRKLAEDEAEVRRLRVEVNEREKELKKKKDVRLAYLDARAQKLASAVANEVRDELRQQRLQPKHQSRQQVGLACGDVDAGPAAASEEWRDGFVLLSMDEDGENSSYNGVQIESFSIVAQEHAAVGIQALFRGSSARRTCAEREAAAIRVQCAFRCRLARLRAQSQKEHIKRNASAVQIQAMQRRRAATARVRRVRARSDEGMWMRRRIAIDSAMKKVHTITRTVAAEATAAAICHSATALAHAAHLNSIEFARKQTEAALRAQVDAAKNRAKDLERSRIIAENDAAAAAIAASVAADRAEEKAKADVLAATVALENERTALVMTKAAKEKERHKRQLVEKELASLRAEVAMANKAITGKAPLQSISAMGVEDVTALLESMGLPPSVAAAFDAAGGVDGPTLAGCTEASLDSIGVKDSSHRGLILAHVRDRVRQEQRYAAASTQALLEASRAEARELFDLMIERASDDGCRGTRKLSKRGVLLAIMTDVSVSGFVKARPSLHQLLRLRSLQAVLRSMHVEPDDGTLGEEAFIEGCVNMHAVIEASEDAAKLFRLVDHASANVVSRRALLNALQRSPAVRALASERKALRPLLSPAVAESTLDQMGSGDRFSIGSFVTNIARKASGGGYHVPGHCERTSTFAPWKTDSSRETFEPLRAIVRLPPRVGTGQTTVLVTCRRMLGPPGERSVAVSAYEPRDGCCFERLVLSSADLPLLLACAPRPSAAHRKASWLRRRSWLTRRISGAGMESQTVMPSLDCEYVCNDDDIDDDEDDAGNNKDDESTPLQRRERDPFWPTHFAHSAEGWPELVDSILHRLRIHRFDAEDPRHAATMVVDTTLHATAAPKCVSEAFGVSVSVHVELDYSVRDKGSSEVTGVRASSGIVLRGIVAQREGTEDMADNREELFALRLSRAEVDEALCYVEPSVYLHAPTMGRLWEQPVAAPDRLEKISSLLHASMNAGGNEIVVNLHLPRKSVVGLARIEQNSGAAATAARQNRVVGGASASKGAAPANSCTDLRRSLLARGSEVVRGSPDRVAPSPSVPPMLGDETYMRRIRRFNSAEHFMSSDLERLASLVPKDEDSQVKNERPPTATKDVFSSKTFVDHALGAALVMATRFHLSNAYVADYRRPTAVFNFASSFVRFVIAEALKSIMSLSRTSLCVNLDVGGLASNVERKTVDLLYPAKNLRAEATGAREGDTTGSYSVTPRSKCVQSVIAEVAQAAVRGAFVKGLTRALKMLKGGKSNVSTSNTISFGGRLGQDPGPKKPENRDVSSSAEADGDEIKTIEAICSRDTAQLKSEIPAQAKPPSRRRPKMLGAHPETGRMKTSWELMFEEESAAESGGVLVSPLTISPLDTEFRVFVRLPVNDDGGFDENYLLGEGAALEIASEDESLKTRVISLSCSELHAMFGTNFPSCFTTRGGNPMCVKDREGLTLLAKMLPGLLVLRPRPRDRRKKDLVVDTDRATALGSIPVDTHRPKKTSRRAAMSDADEGPAPLQRKDSRLTLSAVTPEQVAGFRRNLFDMQKSLSHEAFGKELRANALASKECVVLGGLVHVVVVREHWGERAEELGFEVNAEDELFQVYRVDITRDELAQWFGADEPGIQDGAEEGSAARIDLAERVLRLVDMRPDRHDRRKRVVFANPALLDSTQFKHGPKRVKQSKHHHRRGVGNVVKKT